MANIKPEKFLLEEDDGLPMRDSGDYAKDKLIALKIYLEIAMEAMKNKKWRAFYYIDVMCGSGKNKVRNTQSDIFFGSPFIALNTSPQFTDYRFNDLHLSQILVRRLSRHSQVSRVRISSKSAQNMVADVVKELKARDEKYIKDVWPTFNIAFLDPENPSQLPWTVIQNLAQVRVMDLIINFPTQAIRRMLTLENSSVLDEFFGTPEWRVAYNAEAHHSYITKSLIDFYLQRLQSFGYHTDTDDELARKNIQIKNSKNSQVYSMIFASKHPLGHKLWSEATKRLRQPPLL